MIASGKKKTKWMQAARENMKRRGTEGAFSAAAKRAGEGTQEYAQHVLASPDASPTLRKRANFARNVAK